MARFGSPTSKRHRMWSNDRMLLDKLVDRAGHMTRDQKPKETLAKTYVDRQGVKRMVGKKTLLKQSQPLA